MSNATIDPCKWDITVSYHDGDVDTVSVRRDDGLAFEHAEWQIAEHVRAVLAADGVDAGRQLPEFVKGRTVCIVRD